MSRSTVHGRAPHEPKTKKDRMMTTRPLRRPPLAAFSLALLASPFASASDSTTVTINATIVGVCKFFTSSPTMNINNTGTGSNIDPSLTGDATGSAAITYRCSNGTAPTFTVPATATISCTTSGTCGSSTMTPTISSTGGGNGTGMGSGQEKTLTVTGTITSTSYQNMSVGSYAGTMTVSIAP
jgi:hypothetical protein